MTTQLALPEELISKIKCFTAKAHPTAIIMREQIQYYNEFLDFFDGRFVEMFPDARENFRYFDAEILMDFTFFREARDVVYTLPLEHVFSESESEDD